MRARLPSTALLAGATMLAVAGILTAGSLPSCQTYQPPPTATIEGLNSGILNDPQSPIVLEFSAPVDPRTVSVEVAPFTIDADGNLPDETPDGGSLDILLRHTPTTDTHVSASWSSDHTTLTLTPSPQDLLPVGPSLVMLVLPGVTSTTTPTVLHYRERIPFSYQVERAAPAPTRFRGGTYFFLLQVQMPVPIELKAFAAIDVNAQTGAFVGQFTAALRNSDPSRCDPECTGGLVCELIPSEMCVEMSQAPSGVNESTDYLPKATAPNGYTFEMHGTASNVGDAGAVNIVTSPGVLNVSSPPVSIQGLTFTAQFVPTDGGLIQGSGSLTATKTFLLSSPAGPGSGTLSALTIPDADVPPALPQPGAFADAGVAGDADASDAGSDASEE